MSDYQLDEVWHLLRSLFKLSIHWDSAEVQRLLLHASDYLISHRFVRNEFICWHSWEMQWETSFPPTKHQDSENVGETSKS